MKFSDSIVIDRPLDAVFAQWTDVEKYPEWAGPVLQRKKLTDGPVAVGTRFRAADKWPGRRVEFDMEITEYVENEQFGARWFEPMEGSWTSRLSEVDGGTLLDFEIEMELPLVMRLLSPFMKWWAGRQNRRFMESFKRHVESLQAAG